LRVSRRASWGSSPRPPFSRFARRAVTGKAPSLSGRNWPEGSELYEDA